MTVDEAIAGIRHSALHAYQKQSAEVAIAEIERLRGLLATRGAVNEIIAAVKAKAAARTVPMEGYEPSADEVLVAEIEKLRDDNRVLLDCLNWPDEPSPMECATGEKEALPLRSCRH
ncbi:hypothetical protein M0R72_10240 [Candidatus Pacearchaeota archaeon]|nr:hypothetical protein [Candidatus Pacearchaeota archaeon]